jgi:hypothetical protein
MSILSSLGRYARLASIVGLAAGATLLSFCTRTVGPDPGEEAGIHDAHVAPDAGPDASASPDATVPADAADRPDAKLWDVLCE